MAESRKSPVVTFLREKAVLIALVAIVVVAALYVGLTRTADNSDPAAGPEPTAAPTAVLGDAPEGPAETPAGSGSPGASNGAEEAPEARQTESAAPGQEPQQEIHVGNAQQAVEAGDWQPVADGFAAAWANPEGGKDAWLKRLRPYVTDSLYRSFGYTDISNIPDDEYLSSSPMEEGGGTMSFQAHFVDGGNRFNGLLEIQNDGTWLVKTIGRGGSDS